MSHRKIAEIIFRHALEAVEPSKLVRNNLRLLDNTLHIAGESVNLQTVSNIYVVGAGKAAAPMAQAAEEILGNRLTEGAVVTKYGHSRPLRRVQTTEAGHPLPDANGLAGTQKITKILAKTQPDDLVLLLLSGGGSALLADVPPGCTLADLQACSDALLRSGADIAEMNTVRKHLSALKGGGLARLAAPARTFALILSDVPGDRLDVIASGPTVPDPSTFADAWGVLEKYHLTEKIPPSVQRHLQAGLGGQVSDTPKPNDPAFARVTNRLIGNNALALAAAREKAKEMGFSTEIIEEPMSGEARDFAKKLLKRAADLQQNPQVPKPCCLLAGGETTVTVRGTGLGGRNQELALAAAVMLVHQPGITLLSAGTDGTDGPTFLPTGGRPHRHRPHVYQRDGFGGGAGRMKTFIGF
ncbi:MAG: DUF4147 domain-containing protein [Cytophagales bacterium]|nr:DUF4147 domain-containing protein [Cytophagales bacterium]